MSLSKNDEIFWMQSIASDVQNCAYNVAQDSVDNAHVFMNHAQKILIKVKSTSITTRIVNTPIRYNTTEDRIKLADKLCTLADLLLLQTI